MATKYITICHCDICGEKVDKLTHFYWGELQYDREKNAGRAMPDGCTECCTNCRHELYATIAAKISELKDEIDER